MALHIFLFAALHAFSLADSCDVEALYEEVQVDPGTLAMVGYGTLEEVEQLFLKTSLDAGDYSVTITREDDDFYRVNGHNVYVRTRYCYEYATSDDAILKVESIHGYTLGRLIFTN